MNSILMLAQQAAAAPDDAWLIWGFALFGAALILFALEFVLPSGGLIATLCVLAAASGVFCFFMHSATWGLASLAASLAGAPVMIGYGLKLWSNSPLAHRVVLSQSIQDPSRTQPGEAGVSVSGTIAIGTVGRAETTLRPVGWIRIGSDRREALAEEGFIEVGRHVRVTGVEDGTLRVRADDSK
ncbi:MAG: hypothetical protein K8R92_05875 [Planctomycetes bacterium]|nr:hypothetical protein [Planctomycetota bacterium]